MRATDFFDRVAFTEQGRDIFDRVASPPPYQGIWPAVIFYGCLLLLLAFVAALFFRPFRAKLRNL